MNIQEALDTILEDRKSYGTSLNYAVAYTVQAKAMWHGKDYEGLRVQLLYVLNNITHWRHPKAKEVRQAIRAYLKGA